MTAKACTDCDRAKTRLWHGFDKTCPDCVIRDLAMSPRPIRDAAYDHAERWIGADARRALAAKVKEEHERIQLLKNGNQPAAQG